MGQTQDSPATDYFESYLQCLVSLSKGEKWELCRDILQRYREIKALQGQSASTSSQRVPSVPEHLDNPEPIQGLSEHTTGGDSGFTYSEPLDDWDDLRSHMRQILKDIVRSLSVDETIHHSNVDRVVAALDVLERLTR